MKLGFISDLHYDVNKDYSKTDFFDAFKTYTDENLVEAWFIAGDIANSFELTSSFVEELQDFLALPVYFIPGNHDYRVKDPTPEKTWEIHEKFNAHSQCIQANPVFIGDTMIVGHCAWYDYTFADPKFSRNDLEKKRHGKGRWNDDRFIDWGDSDINMSRRFAQETANIISKNSFKDLIIMTHMLTIEDYKVQRPDSIFEYFNAYLGTSDFADIFEEYKPRDVIMGHVHYRYSLKKNDTNFHVTCLGYLREFRSRDFQKEFNDSVVLLEVVA